MSQLYDLGYNPALDGNGEPYPGALLHTYIPGTTTPKATYTSDALSTPNANPLVADSAGRFEQMFATEGEVFDLVLTDSAGGNSRTFENVTALGGNEDVLEKNFGVNGRFQVYGQGGVVQIETGPPTGDDVGGEGRIGGWDGTQGDALEIDYAATSVTGNLSVAGNLTVTGSISNAPSIISRGSVTAASSMAVALPSGYTSYRLEIRYIGLSTTAQLIGVFAFDSVPTYKTGATDYINVYFAVGGGGFALTGGSTASTGGTGIAMNTTTGLAVNKALGSNASFQITSVAGSETSINGFMNLAEFPATNRYNLSYNVFGSTNNKNYGKATYLKISPDAGTMDAQWTLYGLPV